MPYRKETGNEYLWKQMGLELEAVRLLLIGIVCDEKYHLMIPKTVMKDLDNSIRYLGKFRENAELRMHEVKVDSSLYGHSEEVQKEVEDFRQTIKRKAAPKLKTINGVDLQKMSNKELAAMSKKEGD